MCVLYVSFGSKVKVHNLWVRSAMLFILGLQGLE